MATATIKNKRPAAPPLNTEAASRLKDPFEQHYLGLLQSNDPVLLEKGHGNFKIYRDLKLDGKVFDGLQKRTLALVGYEWSVEPLDSGSTDASEESASNVTAALKHVNFDQVCKDLLDALLLGLSVCEIVWTVRDGWIVPDRIIKRRSERFVFVQPDAHLPPELRLLTAGNLVTGEPLPDKKFIVHRVNAEDDNPYGNGLGAQSYWPVFFKRKGIVAWNKLIDRFGTPTRVGKYPANASPKDKSTLLAALQAFAQDGSITIPEGMSLELLESKLTGGISTHSDLCRYMDAWLDAVWLGKETADGSGGAQAAAAKERSDVRLAITKGDADLLSGTLNATLIKWMCELNGWQPCLVYRQIKEEIDLKAESETDKNISDMGFELSEEGARAKYGEYWSRKAASTPTDPTDAPPQHGNPSSFAENQPAAPLADLDALDVLAAEAAAEWELLLDPLLEPVQQLLEQAAARGETAAEVLAQLPQALAQMGATPLHDRLTQAAFVAHAGGQAGVEV